MVSGDTGNVVPGNRLRVRAPCPPLIDARRVFAGRFFLRVPVSHFGMGVKYHARNAREEAEDGR